MPVTGIQYDSRRVQPGDLFVAIPGHRADGHEFIADAIERGAVALVGERSELNPEPPANVTYITVENARCALARLACAFYDHPTRELFTVGVTGTKGKTSVAHFSAAVLGEEKTVLISTITNSLRRDLEQTTPEAPLIQKIAHQAVIRGKRHLVLEASAHGLSLERVRSADFDAAVFTNLTHDHLDFYGDRERYLEAKLRLFRALKPSATALVNIDDPAGPDVIRATKAHVVTYGLCSEAEVWAEGIKQTANDIRSLVHTPWGSTRLQLGFPGVSYLYNALAALGVGLVRGLSSAEVASRLEAVSHIEGRMERHPTGEGYTVVIDFAHSPASLEQTLKTLRPFYDRLITVFGCGGDSDREKRPIMGGISARYSDHTIVTSDNPKSEDPRCIIEEIERGIPHGCAYEAIVDRKDAIRRALELAEPQDCLLIAGKGHERTQIFKDREIPFNDRDYLVELGVISHSPFAEAPGREPR